MRLKLDIPRKISNAAFERFGNPCERFEGDLLFGAFDVPDVISRQIGFFGQFLLAQTKFFPPEADGFSHNSINFARR
jgi:hypothetical protein